MTSQMLDVGVHERRRERRMQDPEYRAAYERAAREIAQTDAVIRQLDALRAGRGISKAELARRVNRNADPAPIGLAAIEGAVVPVIERIDSDHGLIKIEGELWTARPLDHTQVIEPGERVRVIEIKGAIALVWRE